MKQYKWEHMSQHRYRHRKNMKNNGIFCPFCSLCCQNLSVHLSVSHDIKPRDYKIQNGMNINEYLVSENLHKKLSKSAKINKLGHKFNSSEPMVKEALKNKKPQYKSKKCLESIRLLGKRDKVKMRIPIIIRKEKFSKIFGSISEAAIFITGKVESRTNVVRACKGKLKKFHGYECKYLLKQEVKNG